MGGPFTAWVRSNSQNLLRFSQPQLRWKLEKLGDGCGVHYTVMNL